MDEMNEKYYLNMLNDTSRLVANNNAVNLGNSIVAYSQSEALANNVEFWKWMNRNYAKSGIFSSNQSMQQYISQGAGKEEWLAKQLQGKGYEWDWMTAQRRSILNIFNKYDAGDVVNRAASDVTETNIISGKSTEYQMKAYLSKTNPDLHNTPKDMTVVTNAEKVDVVKQNGYEKVESFQNKQKIQNNVDKRMKQIKNGTATPNYNFQNVCGTMAKAGLIGCAIGMTTETIKQYGNWKAGNISDKEYAVEVLKAGGNSGTTAAITAGIMIPIEAAVTAAGVSCPITIPISIVIGIGVDKIVAPCFGRGDYAKYLGQARYYRDLSLMYVDMVDVMEESTYAFLQFEEGMKEQLIRYNKNYYLGQQLNNELDDILKQI